MPKKVKFNFTVEDPLIKEIKKIAIQKNVSASSIISSVLKDYLSLNNNKKIKE